MKRSQTEGSALSRQGSAATNLTTASWDANSSSNHCSICLKSFGRLLQRKHHCRHCGRLVCANCSMKRIALPNNHGIQGINSDVLMTSGASPQPSGTPLLASSGPSQPNGPPVRVCDPCHRVILAKFEKQQQQIQLLDKKLELLKLTSYISDCLLDVFTLDGQFKTICYDESTTIGELMWSIVGIRMACFEVEQDLYSTQSYALLLEHQSIASIMLSWKQRGWKHSKIVIAIYDGQQVFTSTAMLNVTSSNTMTFSGFGNKLKLRSNVTTSSSSANPYNKGSTTTNGSNATLPNSMSMNSMEEQGMEGSTNGIGMTTNDDSIATHTTHSNSVDEFIALQREIERLQIELDKSNRKIDTWRAVFGSIRLQPNNINNTNNTQSSSVFFMGTDGNSTVAETLQFDEMASCLDDETSTVITTSTTTNNLPPPLRKNTSNIDLSTQAQAYANVGQNSSRRDSFWKRTFIGGSSSSSSSSATTAVTASSSSVLAGNNNNMTSPPSFPGNNSQQQTQVNSPNYSNNQALLQMLSHDYIENLLDYSIVNNPNNALTMVTSRQSLSALAFADKAGNSPAPSATTTTATPMIFSGNNAIESQLLQNPLEYFTVEEDKSLLFTRTYYHHMQHLESFLNKYAKFFDTVLRHLPKNIQSSHDLDDIDVINDSGVPTALWVSSLYHMITSMDTVYEQITEYHELLRPTLRMILPSVFRKLISLPIEDIDSVKCTMHCLLKEDLLLQYDPNQVATQSVTVIQESLHYCIEESMMKNIHWEDTHYIVSSTSSTSLTAANQDFNFNATYPFTIFLSKISSSSTAIGNLSFAVMEQLMSNSIYTFQYVIGDLVDIFPTSTPSLAILPIYQKLAWKLFDDVIKVWYRQLHQSIHSQSMLTTKQVLAIYNYVSQFSTLMDRYGDFSVPITANNNGQDDSVGDASSTSSNNPNSSAAVAKRKAENHEKWKVKKLELYKLAFSTISQEHKVILQKQFLSINNATSSSSSSNTNNNTITIVAKLAFPDRTSGWELLQPVDQFMPTLRTCEDVASTSNYSQDNSNVTSSGGSGASSNAHLTLPSSSTAHVYPCLQWPEIVTNYVKDALMKSILSCHVVDHSTAPRTTQQSFYQSMTTSSSGNSTNNAANAHHTLPNDIRCNLILHVLEQVKDLVQVQFEYLHQTLSSSTNTNKEVDLLTLQYCAYVNSQHAFIRMFQEEVIDHLLDTLPNLTENDEKQLMIIEDKWRSISQLHSQCIMEGIEALIRVGCDEIKSHMTETLFTNKKLAWNKEVLWINPVKRCLKLKLYILNACLDHNIAILMNSGNGGGVGGVGKDTESDTDGNGEVEDTYLTAQDLKLRFVATLSKMLIQHYIELLLPSSISTTIFMIPHYSVSAFAVNTPSVNHSNLMNRVNEDIQLIISMIEEIRLIVMNYHMNDTTHYIQSNKRRNLVGNNNNNNNAGTGRTTALFRKKTITAGGGGATGTGTGNATGDALSTSTKTISNYQNYQNKQTFEEIVFPLSHFSILLSMLFSFAEVNYSVSFVKKEVIESYGIYGIHLWQLLCVWRGDKKESIINEYNQHFKEWYQVQIMPKSERIQSYARMDLSFLLKSKYANIVKL